LGIIVNKRLRGKIIPKRYVWWSASVWSCLYTVTFNLVSNGVLSAFWLKFTIHLNGI
jgi:hypothetical protein